MAKTRAIKTIVRNDIPDEVKEVKTQKKNKNYTLVEDVKSLDKYKYDPTKK